ncbi:siderophore ABC transporter substrate-binding protein [Virgibacillus necropolis]|uniref:siderophore ABC transporter substrate-binding protein n=1 Tax=Virgibacillus necropolis TaxID=163877 RepID=UPI00384D48A4
MKKLIVLIMVSLFAIVMTACGTEKDDSANGDTKETITVTHDLGKTKVSKNPEKVVVFDYGTLDTLDKLGIDVTGVPHGSMPTYLSKYEGEEYANVGSLKEPDFEKLSEIDPDLIIISGRQSSLYEQLSELAPTIYLGVDTTNYMESFKSNLDTIGTIFDKKDEIEKELTKIEESISKLQEKAASLDKKALITLVSGGKISAYGSKSRFGMIHDVFGVEAIDDSIEASTHGMNVSFEYVVEQNPDLLYVIDRGAIVGDESSAKQVVENKLVKKTKAYKNDHIVYLDPNYWYLSGGGLVSVQEMVNEIADSLNKF